MSNVQTEHLANGVSKGSRLAERIDAKRQDTNFSNSNDPGFRKPKSPKKKRSVKKGRKQP